LFTEISIANDSALYRFFVENFNNFEGKLNFIKKEYYDKTEDQYT